MKKPSLCDMVLVEWRDSFSSHDETDLLKHEDDCRWASMGFVVKLDDKFITIATGVQLTTSEGKHTLDNLLSIPWTQVLDWWKLDG